MDLTSLDAPLSRLSGIRRAIVRLTVAALAGLGTWLALALSGRPAIAPVAGWDCGALVLCALAWQHTAGSDAWQTRHRAAAEDPGRTQVSLLVIASSAFSLFAALVVMRGASQASGWERDARIILCLAAVALAWLTTHTAYTLRYAHLFYRDDAEGMGGLEFPGGEPPTYVDFAYFAFTVGMTFQVSDVTISSRQIRRAVLGQSLLSFVYNTTIVALAINLVIGMFSGPIFDSAKP